MFLAMRWLVPLLALVAGCNNCNGSSSTATDAAPAAPVADVAKPEASAPEKPRKAPTGGATAMKTLAADVDRLVSANPSAPAEREKLIDMLLQRADFMGKPSDLVQAEQLTKSWPEQHFARAKVLAATMRYEAATKELDAATGLPQEDTNRVRYAILFGHGEYDEAYAMQPSQVERLDAVGIANAGFLALRMQKKEEGRKYVSLSLQKAEEAGAPLPYAWICFQEAMLYTLAGDDMTAESYFGSAVNMVPQYAEAAIHLAPAQQPEVALAALTELAKTSDHPGVLGARAAVLERLGKKDEAKKATEGAAKGFDALVAKLPEAFSGPAAAFYVGPGNDPKKAVALARTSAKARPTEDTMALWIKAADAAKDPAESCAASHAMKELHYSSDRGRALANASCPDAGVH